MISSGFFFSIEILTNPGGLSNTPQELLQNVSGVVVRDGLSILLNFYENSYNNSTMGFL